MSRNEEPQPLNAATHADAENERNYSAAAAAATTAIKPSNKGPEQANLWHWLHTDWGTSLTTRIKTKRQQPTTSRSKATKYFFNIYFLIFICAFILFYCELLFVTMSKTATEKVRHWKTSGTTVPCLNKNQPWKVSCCLLFTCWNKLLSLRWLDWDFKMTNLPAFGVNTRQRLPHKRPS